MRGSNQTTNGFFSSQPQALNHSYQPAPQCSMLHCIELYCSTPLISACITLHYVLHHNALCCIALLYHISLNSEPHWVLDSTDCIALDWDPLRLRAVRIIALHRALLHCTLGKPHVRILGVQPEFCRKGHIGALAQTH